MNLVLLGPPGAGKGTLANLLKKSLGVMHVSSGDILRDEMKNNTPLGKEVKQFIDNGKLVPDEVVTKLIENKFTHDQNIRRGYMLDGYPRTKQQAQDLDKILNKVKSPLDYALYMEATLPVIIQRLGGRRVCRKCGSLFHIKNRPPKKAGICDQCGGELYQRADDNEETIKTRMDVYLQSTIPIVEYYKAQRKLLTLNGDLESEDVEVIILKKFHDDGKPDKH